MMSGVLSLDIEFNGQKKQSLSVTPPVALRYLFLGQDVHGVFALLDLYLPVGHEIHCC